MKKEILLNDGKRIVYELTYKKIKNINLRISRKGMISVSCPKGVSQKTIDCFLIQKSSFIEQALIRNQKMNETENEREDLSRSEIRLFGKSVPRTIRISQKNSAVFENGAVIIQVKDIQDESVIRKVSETLYRDLLLRKVTDYCRQYYPCFEEALKGEFPTIGIRKMQGRFGSCSPSRRALTFSTLLIPHSERCIEYVVVHEMVHFIHPDHSDAFYRKLSEFIPNYHEIRDELNCKSE